MYFSRATTLAVRRAVVVGTCTALALTAVPAEAAKTKKLGKVQNLTMKITKPDAYELAADWDALAGATRYRVVLTNSVDDTRVVRETSNDEWTFRRSALDEGDSVTVQVTPFRETAPRRGTSHSITRTVPDVVAPTGTYTVDVELNTGNATITESDVSDDVVTRTIDWGDGTVEQLEAGSGPAHTHEYTGGPAVYEPTVTLVDDADLTSVVSAGKAIVFDTDAPSGEFTVRSSTDQAWARWTKVSVNQQWIDDDASANEDIARVVHWGDGTTTRWVGDATPTHVYKAAGDFQPMVRLTDEAGKTTDEAAGTVEVAADEAGPRVVVKKPARAKRKSVNAWRTLRGKAVDQETGVRSVTVKVIQRRGKRWFAYRAPAKSWVKAATKRGALRKAKVGTVRPADVAWRMRVKNLRKGTLIVVARGRDNVGNPSAKFVRKQVLSRR